VITAELHGRIRIGGDRAHILISLRPLAVVLTATVVAAVLGVLALGLGAYPVPPDKVIGAFTGTAKGLDRIAVLEWRLPRMAAGLAFGAALAVAGALFQTITRNPLASPDIVGLSSGAFTGMLTALAMFGGSWPWLVGGSLAGGLAAAAVIALLAARGGLQGFRFIVVGIAISAMLAALNTWIVLRLDVDVAIAVSAWGAGTLHAVAPMAVPTVVGILALLFVSSFVVRHVAQLDLGDDAAAATGVRVRAVRGCAIALGVALVSIVTAAAGPIAFIALAAPQIARRLAGTPGIPLASSAAVGAALLLGSDLIAQHLIPLTVPVGVVTIVIGGAYLVWLLAYEARRIR
jgi:iron complex transport system permease protein